MEVGGSNPLTSTLSAQSLKGQLLVASPRMSDQNFDRSIVLLIEHGPQGAIGVILNRPGEDTVQQHLPEWWDRAAPPSVVFQGGPVRPTAAICLGVARTEEGGVTESRIGFQLIFGELGVVDLGKDPEETGVVRLRVFAGYAGWAPGQLEAELDVGGWFVAPAEELDALTGDPEELWRTVLRRQSDPALVSLANFPTDPALN